MKDRVLLWYHRVSGTLAGVYVPLLLPGLRI